MFVTPKSRRFFHGKSGKKELGSYRNVEQSGNFWLQERKNNFLTAVQSSIVSNSRIRVTHKLKKGYHVVAEGDSMEDMRKGPWKYITSEDFKCPDNLSKSQLTRWIVGHFTQLAIEQKSTKRTMPRTGAELVQSARRARRAMMKSLKVNLEVKSIIGTRIEKRHVCMIVLFAFLLALLRRDTTIFISILTAINTFYLVVQNGSIEFKEQKLSIKNEGEAGVESKYHRKSGLILSPALCSSNANDVDFETTNLSSPGIVHGSKDQTEIERKNLIAIARDMEQSKNVDNDVTTELATLYRTIADLTLVRNQQDSLGGESDTKVRKAPNGLKFEILDMDTPRRIAPYNSVLSSIEASKFMVRGPTYTQDGIKVPSGKSVYEFVGWDGFKVKSKFYHASRFITAPLPPKIRKLILEKKETMSKEEFEELKQKTRAFLSSSVNGVPRYFVVNLQSPDYDPKVFGGPWDGPGFGIVAFFCLSDAAVRQLKAIETGGDDDDDDHDHDNDGDIEMKEEEEEEEEDEEEDDEKKRNEDNDGKSSQKEKEEKNPFHPHAVKLLQRFMNGDLETATDRSTLLGRSKCFPVCMNFENIANMNQFVVKSLNRYNGKPLLTAPKHVFYRGDGYMELNMDLHRYSYVSRSLNRASRSIYNKAVLGLAFGVEARSIEELPEQLYACVSLHQLNFDALTPLEEVYQVPTDRLPGFLNGD